ncbi:MAG: hypothetical protein AAF211_27575, partial [Myxococcota bacterium]
PKPQLNWAPYAFVGVLGFVVVLLSVFALVKWLDTERTYRVEIWIPRGATAWYGDQFVATTAAVRVPPGPRLLRILLNDNTARTLDCLVDAKRSVRWVGDDSVSVDDGLAQQCAEAAPGAAGPGIPIQITDDGEPDAEPAVDEPEEAKPIAVPLTPEERGEGVVRATTAPRPAPEPEVVLPPAPEPQPEPEDAVELEPEPDPSGEEPEGPPGPELEVAGAEEAGDTGVVEPREASGGPDVVASAPDDEPTPPEGEAAASTE